MIPKVVKELGESLERERHREHDARTVLEGAVSRGGVVLPEVDSSKGEGGMHEYKFGMEHLILRMGFCTVQYAHSLYVFHVAHTMRTRSSYVLIMPHTLLLDYLFSSSAFGSE